MNSDLVVVEKPSQLDLISKVKKGDAEESYFGTGSATGGDLNRSSDSG